MLEHDLKEGMTPEQILHHVQAAERAAHALLERAAHLTADLDERRLFERLAAREQDTLRDLAREEERLDAEAFVQRALDC